MGRALKGLPLTALASGILAPMRTTALPVLLAVLTACPPPPLDSGTPAGPSGEIALLFPETNPDISYCPELTAYVAVSDFTLSPDIGGAAVDGEGHWHLLREVQGCQQAVIAESSASFVELVDGAALPTGNHSLTVELVDNQHQPLVPAVRFEANIRVDDSADCVGG